MICVAYRYMIGRGFEPQSAVGRGFEPQSDLGLFFAEILILHCITSLAIHQIREANPPTPLTSTIPTPN
jgi:hypothetical protein